MSARARAVLIEEAFRLSKAAAPHWKAFMIALDNYATDTCREAVGAPPEFALIAHGKAQAMVAFGEMMTDIEDQFARIDKARQASSGRAKPEGRSPNGPTQQSMF